MKSLCRKLFILLLAGTFLSPAMAEGNRYWSGRFRIGMRKTTVWIAAALFAAVLSFFSISGAAAKEVNLNSPAGTAAQPITSVNLLFNAPDGRKLNLIIYGVREGQKAALKNALESHYGSEPLKITIQAKPCGYTGEQLADILRRQNIEPEFADPDFIVLMISAETGEDTLAHLEEVLLQIPLLLPLRDESPVFAPGERALSIREAMLSCSEQLPAAQCLGRILAMPSVGCPPAVPILICGERIDAHAIGCFAYYGIDHCFVVKADT